MKKILMGVSGGPDSIALLHKLYSTNKYEIIVLHVNYNIRKDSIYDQKIVEKFCEERNLKIEILNVVPETWEKYKIFKNKQSMARNIRYDFFVANSIKYGTNTIYIAHHLDDFIETAIMQEGRSKDLLFYGIRRESNYKNLVIVRPLLDSYKEELISYCKANHLNFATDYTNELPIYERNKIRLNLAEKTVDEKNKYFQYYDKINKSHEKEYKKVEKAYEKWETLDFSYDFFSSVSDSIKIHLIYKYLILNDYFIKINKNKIEGVIEFLEKLPAKDKQYRLSNEIYLIVKDRKLIIKED